MSTSSTDEEVPRPLLEVGRIVRPHGLAGEVVVALLSNRHERLEPGSTLIGTVGGERRLLVVAAARPFQQRHLVFFDGVATRSQADFLRDVVLYAKPLEDPDAFFVHELVGCSVIEVSGERRGPVVAVEANPASDLLVLEDGSLVPLRFVVERRPGEVVVDAPAGLFE